MKVALDHVGIAVSDLGAALAFYRDALGLRVEVVEDVVSQHVRAHFIPAGGSTLELLEATAPASAIAKFVERRGPGLHHVTLAVDDIAAALAQLKARGVRLVDDQPRPGAEGAMVAFVHPSAAHGVLVELKQASAAARRSEGTPSSWPRSSSLQVGRHTIGDLEATTLYDGYFRLDGGAMFGIVPRALWERKVEPDTRSRVQLAMRPLLIRGDKTVLVDAGLGDKDTEKFRDIYGVDRAKHLDHALAEAGVASDDIDIVVASHLHFDHVGGLTVRNGAGAVVPRFPRARHMVSRGEWQAATHPSDRSRASYVAENFMPLLDAGLVDFVRGDEWVMPGVRLQTSGGHTMHHMMIWLESGGARAVYPVDIMPTMAHLPNAWTIGFDLYPADAVAAKTALTHELLSTKTLVLFAHDPICAAGYLTERQGARSFTSPS
ncbi:MAG: methylmalonyl-CoA epimerase [Vicinamibacterales bacterium]